MKKFFLVLSFLIGFASLRAEFQSLLSTRGEIRGIEISEEVASKLKRMRPIRAGNDVGKSFTDNTPSKISRLQNIDSSSVFGYLYYSSKNSNVNGIYQIDGDNFDMLYIDGLYQNYWVTPINGWYNNGKVCGVTMVIDENEGIIYGYIYYELDFATGNLLYLKDLELIPIMFLTCTLNPEDQTVYGYVIDLNTGKYYWGYAPLADPDSLTLMQEVTGKECYSMCYNPDDGGIYGMNAAQEFVKIASDGVQTVINGDIAESEKFLDYYAGLTWNKAENLFYANINLSDWSSRIYTVTRDGDFDLVSDFPGGEEFSFMFTANDILLPDQPKAPTIKSIDFQDGELTGSVTFSLPRQTGDGSPLPSSIVYTAMLDGVEVESATASPGDMVTVDYTVGESGMHTFGIYVTANGFNSERVTRNVYIGHDTPKAPGNIKLTTTSLTWDAVKQGVNGGYIDASSITYEVYINDEYKTSTAETSIEVDFSGEQLGAYTATLYAVCNGLTSPPGNSNIVVAGAPYEPPLSILPDFDEAALMTVIDKNRDGYTWIYNNTYNAVQMRNNPNRYASQDDYVFLPPIYIDDNSKYYTFSLRSALHMTNCTREYFEVVYATSPDPSTVLGTIIEKTAPTMPYSWSYEEWDYNEGLWRVPEPGIYYIGIHCISDPDQWGMFVNRFELEQSLVQDSSPSTVTGLKAVAGEKGDLHATLTFTFPETDMGGTVYPEDKILEVMMTDNEVPVDIEISGNPGETITTVVPSVQGSNVFGLRIKDGSMIGPVAYIDVYTGVSVPAQPQNIKGTVGPDMMSATLTWDPVTTPGVEGGYIDPDDVKYKGWIQYSDGWAYYWILIDSDPDAYVTDTTLSFSFENMRNEYSGFEYANAPQNWYNVSVDSFNAAGSLEMVGYPATLYMGKPYELPYSEKFDKGSSIGYSAVTSPWTPYIELGGVKRTAGWSSIPVGGGYALSGYPSGSLPCSGAMGMPRFSTKGMDNAEINVSVRMGSATPEISLYGEIYGSYELTHIGTIEVDTSLNQEFVPVSFPLPERLLDQYWVQIYIVVDYSRTTQSFAMNSVTIDGEASVNSIKGPVGSITGSKGCVILRGLTGQEAVITTIDGKRVASFPIDNIETTFYLDKGLYIVAAGNQRAKVIVR